MTFYAHVRCSPDVGADGCVTAPQNKVAIRETVHEDQRGLFSIVIVYFRRRHGYMVLQTQPRPPWNSTRSHSSVAYMIAFTWLTTRSHGGDRTSST